jgi:sulfoxide reductase heme-binding subunit YedZ
MNTAERFDRLLNNSRFWVLCGGITLSVILTGVIQLYIPSGSLQSIRIEQYFGFISILLLYIAVLASPLTKVFPDIPFKKAYLHARRAIGVLSFYYACVHVYITFFKQLNGFSGLKYLDNKYTTSLVFGVAAFAILFIMTATSLDYAVRKMHFKNWKLLHRLVYFAVVAVLVHIIAIGPHFTQFSLLGAITYVALGFLVLLEAIRIQENRAKKKTAQKATTKKVKK